MTYQNYTCSLLIQTTIVLVFISPYSPDLNPIEFCFGDGKSWLQRHQDVCDKYPKRCFEIALHQVNDLQYLCFNTQFERKYL